MELMLMYPRYAEAVAKFMRDEENLRDLDNVGSGKIESPMIESRPMQKRNSELLNSLLGLPKNILKSGR